MASKPTVSVCGSSTPTASEEGPATSRVFLLSPANASAIRGRLLLNPESKFDLAQRVRRNSAPLGEVFSFISSLYFRGKLAYAEAFSHSKTKTGVTSILVMTSSRGLLTPETVIGADDLIEMSAVPIDPSNRRYRDPLCRDADKLARLLPTGSQIVLLGSVASGKYVDPLLEIFGTSLLFPQLFVGRGDMSRGGLMLRCVQDGLELKYVPVESAIRRGPRPPKLSSRVQVSPAVGRRAG